MNHLEVWEAEKASEAGDVSWDRWIAKVEKKLGCPDLDSWSFGISLIDHAYAAFCAGLTVSNYWSHVASLQAYLLLHGEEDAREQILADYHEWKAIARRRAA